MKISIGAKTIAHPHPAFIVGSYTKEGKANMMAAAWGGICCSRPPCIAISLRKATLTYHNIMHHKAFTINIPSSKFIKEVDYVGIYSGKNTDKFADTGLTPVKSDLVNAPMVEEFPYSLECKLIKTTDLGLHTQFIGEILDIKADKEILTGGEPDIEKVKPLIYASGTNRAYYTISAKLSDAFSAGKNLKKKTHHK
ncbi:MAG TPA: flavin reductase family protein [Elusimicrobiales bacterium]|nr:flavin reductase family protein [Elusimicrobiales bacterium]